MHHLDLLIILASVVVLAIFGVWLTTRYIPNNYVGIVEKFWSRAGSVSEGQILALQGEAGYQADLLRGGLHCGLWRWQYRIHKARLVNVPQGKIGYVYARDGEPLQPSQTLGRVVPSNNFQDARAFLLGSEEAPCGQRGRQRAILREGVYAINLALFVVITEDVVCTLPQLQTPQETRTIAGWQEEFRRTGGFNPVVIGASVRALEGGDGGTRRSRVADNSGSEKSMFCPSCRTRFTVTLDGSEKQTVSCPSCGKSMIIGMPIPPAPGPLDAEAVRDLDTIGIMTVHDGPSLPPGEIIAPPVGTDADAEGYHNNFQDPEAFLLAGGRRGRQYVALTDGTYFINRWFATVEMLPKTVVPVGYVGVVVSYYGRPGRDISGEGFRHGERVAEGERGVWERPLGPGKYPFNTYAGQIILVPTTNFVLHWITDKTESHRYDENLESIDLVTKDAFEPLLPLSVVVHIDYEKAPRVIQRFGDVKRLITQTLDPMLSAYFRDIAHKKTMLELLQQRDAIQSEAREELRRKFRDFDIECVDVLIGKPDTEEAGGTGKIEVLLEQLRLRQLSIEQIETYERQRAAADKLRVLNEANAQAAMQTQLTNTRVQVQIAESQAEADLARSRKQAEQTVVQAEAELERSRRQAKQTVVLADADLERSRRQAEQTVVLAEAESRQKVLAGRGEGQRVLQVGLSEATVLLRKIGSYGDPRLYALALVAEHLARSKQPLVPERMFVAGGNGDGRSSTGLLGTLIELLVADKSGFQLADDGSLDSLKEFAERMTREAMASVEQGAPARTVDVVVSKTAAPNGGGSKS
ncbi:MAG TPA: SPFH domain-containing protein [Gemmataceae bacterium]|nr:SPFH domain-containing protein [Gemmataceae bacterium]